MIEKLDDNFYLVLAVLVFVAVVLLIEGLYLMWRSYRGPQARQMERRLRSLSAAGDGSVQARLLRQRMLSEVPFMERLLYALPRLQRADRLLLQADLRWTVSRLFLTIAAGLCGGFLLGDTVLRQPLVLSLLLAAALGGAPLAYVLRRRAKRIRKLEQQLPDALDLLSRSLRAGHAFSSGLQMIGDEMQDPIATEFRAVADEINFGVSMEQALENLVQRVPVTDLRYFVVSVLVQRESGGNLTEVLGNLSRLIRERLKLFGRIRVLSAEGRMSAWVLGILPFALGALMTVFNPEFMTPMWEDPIGIAITRTVLVTMAFGMLVLRKMTKIRV